MTGLARAVLLMIAGMLFGTSFALAAQPAPPAPDLRGTGDLGEDPGRNEAVVNDNVRLIE